MSFNLSNIKTKEDLKRLFITKWNWDPPAIPRFYPKLPDELSDYLVESIIIAEKSGQSILLIKLKNIEDPDKKLKSIERKILNTSDFKNLLEDSIFIFEFDSFNYIDFVKADKVGGTIRIRKFSISPENRDKLRTPSEQLENLKLQPDDSIASIKNKIEEAFSIESVTEKFYEGYIDIFGKIKRALNRQKVTILKDKEKSLREYIHQLLNRIMFLYFVQKRGCFSGNKKFLADFWDSYKTKFRGHDKFHKDWLNVLFFEALCLPAYLFQEKPYLGQFNKCLKEAPYLNGGLFEKNDLDKIKWYISDTLFEDIFDFFESFNFTVEESTPFDIDISINPEMLGNIYEHLVNIEEQEAQARAGIFYTPKAEIELMLRLSLIEFLFDKLNINKEKLYDFMFSHDINDNNIPFNKAEAEQALKELDQVVILDPACGSGHYLVVTAQILYQLKERLWNFLQVPHLDKYEEKKKIIERNIYGNDIKEWAVEIAKLRLWLELFVDADLIRIKDQDNPLLPNLSFKIRCGDSLVQRIGDKLVPIRKIKQILERRKSDLKELIQRKEYVYKQGSPREYLETLKLEKDLLIQSILDMQNRLDDELFTIIHKNKHVMEVQKHFDKNITTEREALSEHKRTEKIESLTNQIKELEEIKKDLGDMKEPPMIWDLSFAEIFQMKNGFDIIIANPPYVRQENIEDLQGFYEKKEYKDKLIEQIKEDWKYDYEGKLIKSPVPNKFDKRCDLYVYFYLKGLKLLNPNGILCYISSNAWLDVGYGRILQEILLKISPIVGIFDNHSKRSFKHADINTIIAIIRAPDTIEFSKKIKLNEVNFVVIKKPFEEALAPELFINLEKGLNIFPFIDGKYKNSETLRLIKINQKKLFEIASDEENGKYIGDKWGSKYSRSPEIYWKILEKNKYNFINLSELANLKRGLVTGLDSYLFLGEAKVNEFSIEKRYLEKVLVSPRAVDKIFLNPDHLSTYAIYTDESKKNLKGTNLLYYLSYCEKNGALNRSIAKNKDNWYIIRKQNISLPCIAMPRAPYTRYIALLIKDYVLINDMVIIEPKNIDHLKSILAFLNSSLAALILEIIARQNLGLGTLKFEVQDAHIFPILDPKLFYPKSKELDRIMQKLINRKIGNIFYELGFDIKIPIRSQLPNPLPDRKALDDIIFDALGLTEEERKEVYWAVAELVQNRLQKARST